MIIGYKNNQNHSPKKIKKTATRKKYVKLVSEFHIIKEGKNKDFDAVQNNSVTVESIYVCNKTEQIQHLQRFLSHIVKEYDCTGLP